MKDLIKLLNVFIIMAKHQVQSSDGDAREENRTWLKIFKETKKQIIKDGGLK